jgi:cell division protein FtsN
LKWLVQVGAYAQAENASNVLSQVQGLGLDARSEPIPMSSGQMLTRVVVGPYDVQSEAEQAMLRIKALDLPVVILRQR